MGQTLPARSAEGAPVLECDEFQDGDYWRAHVLVFEGGGMVEGVWWMTQRVLRDRPRPATRAGRRGRPHNLRQVPGYIDTQDALPVGRGVDGAEGLTCASNLMAQSVALIIMSSTL
jgi:hypothetical protein